MIANYHTHTYRCGHAVGEDREYVETAIARGLKTLGFSEHIPMPFPDGHEARFRMPFRLLDDWPTDWEFCLYVFEPDMAKVLKKIPGACVYDTQKAQ